MTACIYFLPMCWFSFLSSLFDALRLKEAYLNANSSMTRADNIIPSPISVLEFSCKACMNSSNVSVRSCKKQKKIYMVHVYKNYGPVVTFS